MNDEIRKMLISIDPSFAGDFDFKTFTLITEKKVFKEMKQEDLVNAFKILDKNNTGKIKTEDFRKIIDSVASENNYLTSDEVADFVELADPKHDGLFNYNNFIRFLSQDFK